MSSDNFDISTGLMLPFNSSPNIPYFSGVDPQMHISVNCGPWNLVSSDNSDISTGLMLPFDSSLDIPNFSGVDP